MSDADTRGFGLRLRLLGLIVMVLVPWLALLLYTTADERRHAIANVDADAMRLIRIISSNQAAQIEGARQLLTAFARMPQLRDAKRDECSRLLAELLPAYLLYLNFALAEPDGTMSCSARAMPASVNIADRAYFKRALASRDFAIGDYQVGRVTNVPAINYAYPLIDGTGEIKCRVRGAKSELAHCRTLEAHVPKWRDHGRRGSQWHRARPDADGRRRDRLAARGTRPARNLRDTK